MKRDSFRHIGRFTMYAPLSAFSPVLVHRSALRLAQTSGGGFRVSVCECWCVCVCVCVWGGLCMPRRRGEERRGKERRGGEESRGEAYEYTFALQMNIKGVCVCVCVCVYKHTDRKSTHRDCAFIRIHKHTSLS